MPQSFLISDRDADHTLPTFLILGTAKAGTTSLYHHFKNHPEVFMSPVKEPNFLALEDMEVSFQGPGDEKINQRSITCLGDYRSLFADSESLPVRGEASTLYLYSPVAPQRIQQHTPTAKLIVMLRNPVERAYSAYLNLRRDKREPLSSFSDALAAEQERIRANWQHIWHYAHMGLYAQQLRRYFKLFSRDQMKVIFFERFVHDVPGTLARIADLLEISNHSTTDLSKRHAASGVPRLWWLDSLISLTAKSGSLLPAPVRRLGAGLRKKT